MFTPPYKSQKEIIPMDITTWKEGNATVVAVNGRMDAVTGPDYQKAMETLIRDGSLIIINDFSKLDYISSAGLRSILFTAKLLKNKGGSILFAGVRDSVKEVFEISGFGSIFSTYPSVETALKQAP